MKRTTLCRTAPIAIGLALASAIGATSAQAQNAVWTGPAAEFPHDSYGAPARVVKIRRDYALGATIVTFSTGARLIVKRTNFTPGQVSVVASFGAGRAGVPDKLVHALWATTLFPIGGTRHLSYAELDGWQQSSGHPVNVTLVPGFSAFRLQGEVPAGDLDAELTPLTAYAREPGFRDDMVARIASVVSMLGKQIEGDPSAQFARAVQRRLVGQRNRELPEQAELEATTGSEIPALLGPAFAMAPDIAIVGDIDSDVAIRAVATTLAAGDPRPAQGRGIPAIAPPVARARQSDLFDVGTDADRRVGFYWRLPDIRTAPRIERVARVAAAMIEARLVSSGIPTWAASPAARAVIPPDIEGAGYLGVVLGGGGMSVAKAHALLADITSDVAAGRFTTDELAHARQIVAVEHGAEVTSNAWWAQQLGLVLRDGAMVQALRIEAGGADVDRGEVVACIRRYIAGMAPIIVSGDTSEAGIAEGGAR